MLAVSALVHLLVALALLVQLDRRRPPAEPLPPPAVAVIFEGGAAQGPSQPVPAPEPSAPASPGEPQTGTAEEPSPPTPATPEQIPSPEPPSLPETQPEPAPVPEPVPETAPEPEAAPQAPSEAAPTEPPPPPRVELVLPRPTPPAVAPPAPFVVPELPPAPPAPAPRPAPRAVPRPAPRSAFTPMLRNWSLGAPPPPAAANRGLGPTLAGPNSAASQVRGAERLGTDWRNALSAWVEAHKYYPQAAILNGEDGSPEVRVVVRRDGKVQSVDLEARSGSQWLDIALQALFRGARLPPFPDNAREDQVTFHFTMHYILVRR